MSAASAAASPADAVVDAAPKKSRKKLIVIVATALLALGLAGGGAVVFLKKKAAAAAAAAEEAGTGGHAAEKVDRNHPPTFVPLDAFVVNLADKDADRYAQIGVTLELDDAKFADQIKLYMPAIRNGVLMVLAHKSSRELLERSGKETLAAEILRAAVQPLGLQVEPEAAPKPQAAKPTGPEAQAKEEADKSDAEEEKPVAKPVPKHPAEHNPVRRVHFSNFIIQ